MRDKHSIAQAVSGLSDSASRVLKEIARSASPLTTREISEQIGLSRSPTLNHAKSLHEKGLVLKIEVPHLNPNMPPTFRYQIAPDVDCDLLLASLEEAQSSLVNLDSMPEDSFDALPEPESLPSEMPDWFSEKIPEVRPAYRSGFWDVFRLISQSPGMTANDLVEAVGVSTSAIHSRVKKLIEAELVSRERKGGEFIYFRTESNPNLSARTQHTQSRLQLEPIQVVEKIRQVVEMPIEQEDSTSTDSPPNSKPPLPKLPEYDPSWPDEMKTEWMKTFRALAQGQSK